MAPHSALPPRSGPPLQEPVGGAPLVVTPLQTPAIRRIPTRPMQHIDVTQPTAPQQPHRWPLSHSLCLARTCQARGHGLPRDIAAARPAHARIRCGRGAPRRSPGRRRWRRSLVPVPRLGGHGLRRVRLEARDRRRGGVCTGATQPPQCGCQGWVYMGAEGEGGRVPVGGGGLHLPRPFAFSDTSKAKG